MIKKQIFFFALIMLFLLSISCDKGPLQPTSQSIDRENPSSIASDAVGTMTSDKYADVIIGPPPEPLNPVKTYNGQTLPQIEKIGADSPDTMMKLLQIITNDDFNQLIEQITPIPKEKLSRVDRTIIFSTGCAIIFGNYIQAPLVVNFSSAEKQITVNDYPIIVSENKYRNFRPGYISSLILHKYYNIENSLLDDSIVTWSENVKNVMKSIEKRANCISPFDATEWSRFIHAELSKHTFKYRLSEYEMQGVGPINNPCPSQRFPIIDIVYELGNSLLDNYSFDARNHPENSKLIDKCPRNDKYYYGFDVVEQNKVISFEGWTTVFDNLHKNHEKAQFVIFDNSIIQSCQICDFLQLVKNNIIYNHNMRPAEKYIKLYNALDKCGIDKNGRPAISSNETKYMTIYTLIDGNK